MDRLPNATDTFAPALLRGKRVLVTGATSGVGLDVARGFAALGAEVLAARAKLAASGLLSGCRFCERWIAKPAIP